MEITEGQLNQLDQSGFFKMDQVISKKEFQEIRTRIEDITQGRIQYSGMSFQLDGSSKAYGSIPNGGGFQGPSDNYRKILRMGKRSCVSQIHATPNFQRPNPEIHRRSGFHLSRDVHE